MDYSVHPKINGFLIIYIIILYYDILYINLQAAHPHFVLRNAQLFKI